MDEDAEKVVAAYKIDEESCAWLKHVLILG